jgi:hypothetical protein
MKFPVTVSSLMEVFDMSRDKAMYVAGTAATNGYCPFIYEGNQYAVTREGEDGAFIVITVEDE